MGNLQSTPEYNPYTGTYEYPATGYQSELERYYYRRMYPQQYNSYYSSMAGYNQPGAAASYYNNYQQPYYQQPSVYQSPYNTLGYGYNTSPYQQSVYNNTPYSSSLYGTPAAYGYSNSYYPNYLQRTYM